ncbi:MAG: VWA domain-containing protein, partial [Anaerolineae bacterium]|uniref:vWA domain-containing protein n=1 Tax=Candidatus Amarolinea dominans TaxID=3140696 RepID=UPI003134CC33|nr:VWA domain-containing protein [Anaerolineae bacterium]
QLDVVFVFDVTGSMSAEIDQMKARATEIVQRVQAIVPDTVFAVATLSDYPRVTGGESLFDVLGNLISFGSGDDYPWRMDLDFTPQATRVQSAINNIQLMDGGDGPESYLRALQEVQNLSWRPRTRRIVVLFGDSYAHDPDPGPGCTNGHLGRHFFGQRPVRASRGGY